MITLEKFLELKFTDTINPLYNIKNTDNILIQYISILEPPVEQFVRENEIILSTALSVRDNLTMLDEFISEIYNANACAIIFAFPDNDYTQLRPLLEKYKSLNFPLLTMSWTHLFSDVVENTLKEIWDISDKTKLSLENIQKKLLSAYIAEKNLQDACLIISEEFSCKVIITDTNQNIKNSSFDGAYIHINGEIKTDDYFLVEVTSSTKFYGYLYLEKISNIRRLQLQIFEQYLITPLILWFEREWSVLSSNLKSTGNFIRKVANNSFINKEEALIKAQLFKLNIDCNYITFAGAIIDSKKRIESKENYYENIKAPTKIEIESIGECIYLTANRLGLSIMQCVDNNIFVVFLEEQQNDSIDTANKFLDVLTENIKKYFPKVFILWGFDTQPATFEKLWVAYKNSKKALDVCLWSNGVITRNNHQLSIKNQIINTLSSNEQIVKLSQNFVNALLMYDEKRNSSLLDTLECYCTNNYNLSETAIALNLHRQSLIYRMNKIEQLLNLSLKDHTNLWALEISILIIRYS